MAPRVRLRCCLYSVCHLSQPNHEKWPRELHKHSHGAIATIVLERSWSMKRFAQLFGMKRQFLFSMVVVCVAALLASPGLLAAGDQEGAVPDQAQPMPPPYNPYPPGILPADLNQELARVRREVRFIFNRTLGESRALPPITKTGQP